MFIDSEKRLKQLSDEAKKNTEDLEEAKKNSRFTQVSPLSQYTLRYRYVTGSGLRPDTPKGRCVARNTLA
ncbi:hypothetical protein GKF05_24850 [Escherichia coli]|nr:hypothetical protein [Escherichia coli]